MNRNKRAIILIVVLITACMATFALSQYEEKQEQIKSSDAILLEIPCDTVQTLAWEYEGSSFSFHKENDGWLYDADTAFPVNEEKINSILSVFESFGVAFIIETVEDFNQYGLKEPVCTMQLSTEETQVTIQLGNFSKLDEQRYVSIGDGNVYLVRNDPVDFLETELSAMILHDSLPTLTTATEISVTGSTTSHILYTTDSTASYSEEDVYFMELDGQSYPLDTNSVTSYLSTLSKLTLQNYVTYAATAEELADYGLDTPAYSITVSYPSAQEEDAAQPKTFTLHLGRNVKEAAAAAEAEAAGEEAIPSVTSYVRLNDSPKIYQISDTSFLALTCVAYNDLRHHEVFWGDFDTITTLDITLEDMTHVISSQVSEEDGQTLLWIYQNEEIDLSGFQTALNSIVADSFTEESTKLKEELRLTIHLENATFPTVTLGFYRYDGSTCLVTIDGQSVCFTSRASVVSLIEAVQKIVLH